ncbi:hypothetical protein D9601_04070 [Sphingomonas sp. MA1305]|uniref:hypothetical protein n=1 Tax=unclassified Sphingomonas TaxID=196159 RepID=UPI0018E03F76|nr:hypothetical protein [Sphingomonas sp. MA1305]MBI0474538.1 hypothetical protein [Sphingomonas sp. MA1305]
MAEERIVETPTTHTTVIERRGGGGTAIAIVLLIAVLIGGYFLFVHQGSESAKNNAITSAAKSVEKTADKAGGAIDANK